MGMIVVYTVWTRKLVSTTGRRRNARRGLIVPRMILESHHAWIVLSARPQRSHAPFKAPAELP